MKFVYLSLIVFLSLTINVLAANAVAANAVAANAVAANAEAVNNRAVNDERFVADYFPSGKQGNYGVIVLTGSAGGKTNEMAEAIANLGYPTLSLAYFRDGPLPEALELIPLEYFEAPKQWLMDQKETRADGVLILGLSKGAELALVLAAHDADYKGTVAVAPSSVVWSGIPKDTSTIAQASSSWSLNGKPLDHVPYVSRTGLKKAGLSKMVYWHTASLANAEAVEKALIRVENIHSPFLLLTGGKDSVWPAKHMAESLCGKANTPENASVCTHINYDEAGHMAGLEHFTLGESTQSTSPVYKDIATFLQAIQ